MNSAISGLENQKSPPKNPEIKFRKGCRQRYLSKQLNYGSVADPKNYSYEGGPAHRHLPYLFPGQLTSRKNGAGYRKVSGNEDSG